MNAPRDAPVMFPAGPAAAPQLREPGSFSQKPTLCPRSPTDEGGSVSVSFCAISSAQHSGEQLGHPEDARADWGLLMSFRSDHSVWGFLLQVRLPQAGCYVTADGKGQEWGAVPAWGGPHLIGDDDKRTQ